MDDPKLKYAIDDIHYVLSVHLRPSFLRVIGLEETPGEINVIVSCAQFKGMSIQKRTSTVFSLLSRYISDTIVLEFLIVAQCFDGNEMLDYLDNCFEEIENEEN